MTWALPYVASGRSSVWHLPDLTLTRTLCGLDVRDTWQVRGSAPRVCLRCSAFDREG